MISSEGLAGGSASRHTHMVMGKPLSILVLSEGPLHELKCDPITGLYVKF